ncbi:hypothetical protein [Pseudocolwellia sp. AS88]|uniref:hypothetical protein n=1 Tax=Pseudocolwellia TaxID=2848177 RepID=UPI0034E95171
MGTSDSRLLISSSVLTRDTYQALFRYQTSLLKLVSVSREIIILIMSIILLL